MGSIVPMERTPREPVGNQVEPLADHDAWSRDVSARWWLEHLLEAASVDADSRARARELLRDVGTKVGSVRLRDAADRANRNDPTFVAGADPRGSDDEIRFDPAWDECLDAVTSSGVCALGVADERAGWMVRAAAMELWARLDIGVMCPVTMTSAALPLLLRAAAVGDEACADLAQRILSASHTGTVPQPLVGMAMTEPQGGSDLAGSTVEAERIDGRWVLSGHKWFCSHPTSDALLVLARDPDVADAEGTRGLSCFLVPGWTADGQRNGIIVQRLKDKLGTRSLASSEVVFDRAEATRVGAAGRGVPTIMQMVVGTRMDCAIGSAGVLMRAITEVLHAAEQREAFGARLVEQPLMRMVLGDLLLEREGALALAFEVARGVQRQDAVSGLVTAVAKYWITRRAVLGCIECVEALGGNGYTEEFVAARLYRDAQVNSTWEGAGNVIALDVLRSLARAPELHDAYLARVDELLDGAPSDIARAVQAFADSIERPVGEFAARRYAGRMAVLLQAALLAHRAGASGAREDEVVACGYVATRIEATPERAFGDGDERLGAAADELLSRCGSRSLAGAAKVVS